MTGTIHLIILLILKSPFKVAATEEKVITSTHSGEVCDVDSACNTITTTAAPTEIQTEKTNVSEKWKYNISDGISGYNESLVDVYRVNENNKTINFEIDITTKTVNQMTQSNETKSANSKYQINIEKDCFCDITKGSCNMNCCCDQDCLYVNRDVFKICNGTESKTDEFCQSKILNSPLLCIVKDNLYSRHFYPQHETTIESTNVEKLLKNYRVYGWSFPSLPPENKVDEELPSEFREYDVDSPIWIFTNDYQIKKFRIPKSTISSRDCENTVPATFLNDEDVVCTYRTIKVMDTACESPSSIFNPARYFANFSIISNPTLVNLSSIYNCSDNCLNVAPYTCESDNPETCKPANRTLKPFFSDGTCQGAVTNVHYNLFHNGTEGVLSANVYLQLTNVRLKPNLLWSIPFKLTHHWVNQTSYYELSGYPGYIFGKPIITGYKTKKWRKENQTDVIIEMSSNKKRWLTVFGINVDGGCLKLQRSNILFRENLYAHCFVDVPKINSIEHCEMLQNEIFSIVFGPQTNISNAYVSVLGDPDVADKSKWAPFVLDLPNSMANETCSGIVTAVKLIVLHSVTGEHDNPQQTIVGVKVNGNSFDRNVSNYEKLKISFAINFYDITKPPLRVFAEPPTYEVKLPTDFFYPFFSKGLNLQVPKYIPSFLLFMLIVWSL